MEGLPCWFRGKEPAGNEDVAGAAGSIPGSGRSPGKGNGNPLQDSCLGNSLDRGAWWATVHGVANKSDTTQRLNKTMIRDLDSILTAVGNNH